MGSTPKASRSKALATTGGGSFRWNRSARNLPTDRRDAAGSAWSRRTASAWAATKARITSGLSRIAAVDAITSVVG